MPALRKRIVLAAALALMAAVAFFVVYLPEKSNRSTLDELFASTDARLSTEGAHRSAGSAEANGPDAEAIRRIIGAGEDSAAGEQGLLRLRLVESDGTPVKGAQVWLQRPRELRDLSIFSLLDPDALRSVLRERCTREGRTDDHGVLQCVLAGDIPLLAFIECMDGRFFWLDPVLSKMSGDPLSPIEVELHPAIDLRVRVAPIDHLQECGAALLLWPGDDSIPPLMRSIFYDGREGFSLGDGDRYYGYRVKRLACLVKLPSDGVAEIPVSGGRSYDVWFRSSFLGQSVLVRKGDRKLSLSNPGQEEALEFPVLSQGPELSIRDRASLPISRALVMLEAYRSVSQDKIDVIVETNVDGVCSLPEMGGRGGKLIVSARGFAACEMSEWQQSQGASSVVLEGPRTLRGSLIRESTGEPIVGAKVWLQALSAGSGTPLYLDEVKLGITSDGGRFEFEDVLPGVAILSLAGSIPQFGSIPAHSVSSPSSSDLFNQRHNHVGSRDSWQRIEVIPSAADPSSHVEVRVAIPEGASLKGVLRDKYGRLMGERGLRARTQYCWPPQESFLTTSKAGEFEFSGLFAPCYWSFDLIEASDSIAIDDFELEAGERQVLDLRCRRERSAALSGDAGPGVSQALVRYSGVCVSDDGYPVAGARISLDINDPSLRAVCDEDGKFSFCEPVSRAAGEGIGLVIEAKGYRSESPYIGGGEKTEDLTFMLERQYTLDILVEDRTASSDRSRGWRVGRTLRYGEAEGRKNRYLASQNDPIDGGVRVGLGRGRFSLLLNHNDYRQVSVDVEIPQDLPSIAISALPWANIRGIVEAPDGTRVGAGVRVVLESVRMDQERSVYTEQDGSFSISSGSDESILIKSDLRGGGVHDAQWIDAEEARVHPPFDRIVRLQLRYGRNQIVRCLPWENWDGEDRQVQIVVSQEGRHVPQRFREGSGGSLYRLESESGIDLNLRGLAPDKEINIEIDPGSGFESQEYGPFELSNSPLEIRMREPVVFQQRNEPAPGEGERLPEGPYSYYTRIVDSEGRVRGDLDVYLLSESKLTTKQLLVEEAAAGNERSGTSRMQAVDYWTEALGGGFYQVLIFKKSNVEAAQSISPPELMRKRVTLPISADDLIVCDEDARFEHGEWVRFKRE